MQMPGRKSAGAMQGLARKSAPRGKLNLRAADSRFSPSPRVYRCGSGQGMFDSFLNSSKFKECLREAVFDALRSEEGQDLLAKAIRRELMKQK